MGKIANRQSLAILDRGLKSQPFVQFWCIRMLKKNRQSRVSNRTFLNRQRFSIWIARFRPSKFLQEKPMSIKFLVFLGGGVFWVFFWGGGEVPILFLWARGFGSVCTSSFPPFLFKTSRSRQKEFKQTVRANCFYLGGWFLGWAAFPWSLGCFFQTKIAHFWCLTHRKMPLTLNIIWNHFFSNNIAREKLAVPKNSRGRFSRKGFCRNPMGSFWTNNSVNFAGDFLVDFFRAFFLEKNGRKKIHPKIHGKIQIRIWNFAAKIHTARIWPWSFLSSFCQAVGKGGWVEGG